jgi:hypothetical protein
VVIYLVYADVGYQEYNGEKRNNVKRLFAATDDMRDVAQGSGAFMDEDNEDDDS